MSNNTNIDADGKLSGGFKKLISNIGDAIQDAATIDVTTFTGDFTYKTHQVLNNGADKVKITNILKNMTVNSQTDLQLVAHTHVEIDSDAATIVKSNLTTDDEDLLALHQEMLESAKESRQAVIDMVKGLLKIK